MSFGDHLDELRRCLLRGLTGVGIAIVIALFFATDLLAFILQPLLVVLRSHGQRPEVQALSPPETFIVYLKISFLSGLIGCRIGFTIGALTILGNLILPVRRTASTTSTATASTARASFGFVT